MSLVVYLFTSILVLYGLGKFQARLVYREPTL